MSVNVVSKDEIIDFLHQMDYLLRSGRYNTSKEDTKPEESLFLAFQELLKKSPDNLFIKVNIARLSLQLKKPKTAIEKLEQVIKENSSNKFYVCLLAQAYYQDEKLEKAVDLIRSAGIIGQGKEAWKQENLEFELEEVEMTKAITDLENEKIIDNTVTLFQSASSFERRGCYQQAIECHLQVLGELPEFFPSLCNIATSYWKIGETQTAKKYYQQTLKLDPTFFEALRNLVNIHFELKEYELAVGVLKKAIKTYPSNPDFLIDLAIAYAYLKHDEKAIKYLHECLELAPEYYLEVDCEPILHPLLKHLV